MLKTAIATAILGLGIAGAYFAIENTDFSPKKISNLEVNSNIFNQPFVEKTDGLDSILSAKPDLKNNRTDQYIGGIIEKIVMENPDISSIKQENGSLNVPDADAVAAELLTNAQLKFSEENIIPAIKDGDIIIIENISIENIQNYAQKSDAISAELTLFDFSNLQEFEAGMPAVVENYKKAVAELYKLPAPKLMVEIHKTKISYLTAELNLFERMKNIKNDPMGALLASRNFLDLEKKFQDELLKKMLDVLDIFKS